MQYPVVKTRITGVDLARYFHAKCVKILLKRVGVRPKPLKTGLNLAWHQSC